MFTNFGTKRLASLLKVKQTLTDLCDRVIGSARLTKSISDLFEHATYPELMLCKQLWAVLSRFMFTYN